MGRVIADQSVSLDGFNAGPNVWIGNGMGDGGEEFHAWMGSEAGQTGRDGTAVESPQELLAARAPSCWPAHVRPRRGAVG